MAVLLVTREHRRPGQTAYNQIVIRSNVHKLAEANFPTRWGQFRIYGFEGDVETGPDAVSRETGSASPENKKEGAVALVVGDIHSSQIGRAHV